MKDSPEFRVVGSASPEEKEEIKENLRDFLCRHYESLSDGQREEFEKLEYPKSENEIALIDFANRETNRLMEEAGVEPYDVPRENFHIVPTEFYRKIEGNEETYTASTFYTKQGIVFDAQHFRSNPINFGAVALHELLHLKGHLAIEARKGADADGDVTTSIYRAGVTARSTQKRNTAQEHHRHFEGLHEAIVSTEEKRTLPKILELPFMTEEKACWESDEAKAWRREASAKFGIPEDDIILARKKEGGAWNCEIISYPQQRKVLAYVMEEIGKEFPDKFSSGDDVFKEFLRAHFTGELLPIAKLVEQTFGEGSFRELGDMADGSNENAVLCLESLRKCRSRRLAASAEQEQAVPTSPAE